MSRIDLNRKYNSACDKGCNKDERSRRAENDSCLMVKSLTDNLPVRCVGQWAEEKIYGNYILVGSNYNVSSI